MKLYRFWAKGEATVHAGKRPWKVGAYGGSDRSIEEAQHRAQERAERMAATIERGRMPGAYDYGDRPVREEKIEEIGEGDIVSAVITRNSYGSLVLNTNRVMFVDVDIIPPSGQISLGNALRKFWANWRGTTATIRQKSEEELLSRFDIVCRSQAGMGFRIYRTFGGFRLLVTSGGYDPVSIETRSLLEAFGSDPLYIRLCKAQECFRARLSAKFWRCGARRPPSRFPWADAATESEYREWENDYHRLANQFAVCELIGSRGAPAIDESVRTVLDTHDRLTMVEGARLA